MSADSEKNGEGTGETGSETVVASTALVALASEVAANVAGASIALEGSTLSILLGAAAVPVIQAAAAEVTGRRSRAFDRRLRKHGVTPDLLLAKIVEDPARLDLFRIAVNAALATDHEAKRRLLADALAAGTMSADAVDASYARRAVTTISRIDTLEIVALGAIEDTVASGENGAATRSEITAAIGLQAGDVFDAALAVLRSEGLVLQATINEDGRWKLTGYGRRLLGELRLAGSDEDE
jgi:hypothetical protein